MHLSMYALDAVIWSRGRAVRTFAFWPGRSEFEFYHCRFARIMATWLYRPRETFTVHGTFGKCLKSMPHVNLVNEIVRTEPFGIRRSWCYTPCHKSSYAKVWAFVQKRVVSHYLLLCYYQWKCFLEAWISWVLNLAENSVTQKNITVLTLFALYFDMIFLVVVNGCSNSSTLNWLGQFAEQTKLLSSLRRVFLSGNDCNIVSHSESDIQHLMNYYPTA